MSDIHDESIPAAPAKGMLDGSGTRAEAAESESTGREPVDPPPLDEATFLRKAKRRSVLRTVLVSGLVMLLGAVLLAGGLVWWQLRLNDESSRIFGYYPWLMEISRPNVQAINSGLASSRFPGGADRYLLARVIGARPVPADEVTVEYDVWGGEQVIGMSGDISANAVRRFEGTGLLPNLAFLHPVLIDRHARGEVPDIDVDPVPGFSAESTRSLARLSRLEPSATVEVAISLDKLMTQDELVSLVGSDALLSWAPVDLWGAQGPPEDPSRYHRIGMPYWLFHATDADDVASLYAGDVDPDRWMVERLRAIERYAPSGTASLAGRSADYIEANGARYYGAVVVGSTDAVSEIARNEHVTAVMTGVVLQPGE